MQTIFIEYDPNQKLFGFCDLLKNNLIPPTYLAVTEFYDQLAWVQTQQGWQLINDNQKVVVSKTFDKLYAHNAYYAVGGDVHNQQYLITHTKNPVCTPFLARYTFVQQLANYVVCQDTNQQQVIFTLDWQMVNNCPLQTVGGFHDGFFVVANENNAWGVMNEAGTIIIPFTYQRLWPMHANVLKAQKDNQTYFIDLKQNKYDLVQKFSKYRFDDCFYDDVLVFQNKAKFGVMNDFFQILYQKKLSALSAYEAGYAKYQQKDKWGLINKRGKFVTGPIFDAVIRWNRLYAYVYKNGLYNYYAFGKKALLF